MAEEAETATQQQDMRPKGQAANNNYIRKQSVQALADRGLQ